MTRANILIASAGTPPTLVVVRGGNGRLCTVAAMPKQPVASDSALRLRSRYLGDACVPVVRVRTVTDRRTSEVPLVDQSLDGVQSFCTIEVGATDAGASDRIGQVRIREVGTGQVGTDQVGTGQDGTGQVGTGEVGTV